MPPAVAAAGIVAAGTIGGAVMGASSQKKAAKQASNAEQQMAHENNALAQQFRAENTANFQPWMQSGTRANSLIDSFLYGSQPASYYPGAQPPAGAAPNAQGLPTQQPTVAVGQPTGAPQTGALGANTGPAFHNALMMGEPAGIRTIGPGGMGEGHPFAGAVAARHGVMAPTGGAGAPATGATPPASAGGAAGGNPMSGYQAFVNSPFYQTGFNEGMRSLNHGLASSGMLESGDAMKSAIRFGQDYSYQQGLMPYLGLAGQQSDRGVQSAGAIAGVGLNALNSMSANNTNAGNAMANAALAKGAANSNMYAGIGSALGTAAGGLFGGSSYRGF